MIDGRRCHDLGEAINVGGRLEQDICEVEERTEIRQLQTFQFSTCCYNPINQPTHKSERISFLAVTRII
jgi:hypothetical protein